MTLLDEVVDYAWFAERWHWPPTVVDEQPVWILDRLPVIAEAFDEARASLQEQAQREAERRAR